MLNSRGILRLAQSRKGQWNKFVVGLMARHERVLHDEGFAVDVLHEPQALIEMAGFVWAKGRYKKKLLDVINRVDDLAIRLRFSGGEDVP